jgi:hypothetical protein
MDEKDALMKSLCRMFKCPRARERVYDVTTHSDL